MGRESGEETPQWPMEPTGPASQRGRKRVERAAAKVGAGRGPGRQGKLLPRDPDSVELRRGLPPTAGEVGDPALERHPRGDYNYSRKRTLGGLMASMHAQSTGTPGQTTDSLRGRPESQAAEPVLPASRARQPGVPAWVRWLLPVVGVGLLGLVWWKQGQTYEAFPIPERAFVRQAPVFQLHDQSMQLLRLQRYIGRHKFLVAFIDSSRGVDQSEVTRSLKERFAEFEQTGGLIVGVTAGRPAENREAIERLGGLPFVLLSDLNQLEVHREWGAVLAGGEQACEGVVIVDRAGWIRFQHFGPENLGTAEQWLTELKAVR